MYSVWHLRTIFQQVPGSLRSAVARSTRRTPEWGAILMSTSHMSVNGSLLYIEAGSLFPLPSIWLRFVFICVGSLLRDGPSHIAVNAVPIFD